MKYLKSPTRNQIRKSLICLEQNREELKKFLLRRRPSELITIREYLYKNREELVDEILSFPAKKITRAMKDACDWVFRISDIKTK